MTRRHQTQRRHFRLFGRKLHHRLQQGWQWSLRSWRSLWRNLPLWGRVIVIGMLLGLTVRSLPYLAPIRAADLAQDDQAIEFRDRYGMALGTLLTRDQEHTAVVALNQVSPDFIHAILAAEDQRFYQHGALDLRALSRALIEAVQAREIVSGASTITMQLARMSAPIPRTLGGKVQEVWRSWRLAAGMSRDAILQSYMNRLPMGGNIYGVEAAARVYFGIPAHDLTLAQASLLAGLPNDPTDLSPYDHWQALKRRQRYVLDRMVADGYITGQQADRTAEEAIALQPRQQGIIAAPQFLFWAASQLSPDHPAQIQTTLDLPLQQFVEAQVRQVIASLADHQVQQAAALVLDNQSGEVLAYVGSVDYFSAADRGRNDGVQALRQPGSTLKPFLYELALDTRVIHPNTVLADVPTHYAIAGKKLYSPTDYSETFQGPVRVRVALANSLNVPAVRVLEKVGVATFLDRLHQLGFAHLTHPPDYYGLGLTLGSGEVSLWELAQAYRVMARQGEASPVAWMINQGERKDKELRINDKRDTWALLINMLSDRHARAKSFGVESVLNLPFPAAVKTGTSSDFRDTWTVGFSSEYTVATWVGNFNGEPMQQVSGVTGAAPLWSRIMLHLHEHREPAPLPTPDGLVQRPICALSGLRPTPACPTVVQEYFYPEDLAAYEQHPDTFYRLAASGTGQSSAQLNLPPEYDEWLAMQQQPSLETNALRIVSPRQDDFFVMAPQSASETAMSDAPSAATDRPTDQRLEFKLATTPSQPVEWWLNGKKLAVQSSGSLFWSMQPGTWTLQVKQGSAIDQVRFQVGNAIDQPTRRGFSIANP